MLFTVGLPAVTSFRSLRTGKNKNNEENKSNPPLPGGAGEELVICEFWMCMNEITYISQVLYLRLQPLIHCRYFQLSVLQALSLLALLQCMNFIVHFFVFVLKKRTFSV